MTKPLPSELATKFRTHTCGELRAEHVWKAAAGPQQPVPIGDDLDIVLPRRPSKSGAPTVVLSGHVAAKLDHETILLRDRYGKTLVRCDPAALPYVPDRFRKLSIEDVIQVSGLVREREEKDRDATLPTGAVFLEARKIEVLSAAANVPSKVLTAPELSQEEKLTFRQLYLRRPEVQARLAFRHKVASAAREFFEKNEFLEVETPHLFWYDPVAIGGEIIPAGRGRAWRLPSGPVVLNQYINAGQFDRTFQFTRITRRENNPTPQHQQEHTGLDINLAYVDVPDFMAVIERMLNHVFLAVAGKEVEGAFPSFSYEEAMLKFGTDKPDVRYDLEIVQLPDNAGRAFRILGGSEKLADKDLEGLQFARVFEKKIEGPAAATFKGNDRILKAVKGAAGDILVWNKGNTEAASIQLGEARVKLARKIGLADPARLAPCWVHSYPFLEDDKGTLVARVVVFSAPLEEDGPLVPDEKQRARIRARAFDLVLNGVELASAYIGNHNLAAQRMIWSNLFKVNTQDLFRLRAPIESHRFAVPPHGGMNIGFDRLVATLLGLEAIDEVMAFPKTPGCKDPMLEAPGPVPAAAVQDLIEDHPRPPGSTIAALAEETANL